MHVRIALLATAALAAACLPTFETPDVTEPHDGSENDDTQTAGAPGNLDDVPELAVTTHGNEPRRQLRRTFTDGDRWTTELTIDEQTALSLNGEERPNLPAPRVTLEVTTEVVRTGDGWAELARTVTDTDLAGGQLHDEDLDARRQLLTTISDVTETVLLTDRGQVVTRSFDTAGTQSAIDRYRQYVPTQHSIDIPLPEDAVGPGALWSVTTDAVRNGVPLRLNTSYTLETVDGDTAVLSATTDAVHRDDTADLDTDPPGTGGVDVHVTGAVLAGATELHIDLSDPAADRYSQLLSGPLSVTFETGGEDPQDAELGLEVQIAGGQPLNTTEDGDGHDGPAG